MAKKFKLWVDATKPAPDDYFIIKSVKDFSNFADTYGISNVELIDIGYEAEDFSKFGGDYINCLDYLSYIGAKNIHVHIHSMNPVGVHNMRTVIERNQENGWVEII